MKIELRVTIIAVLKVYGLSIIGIRDYILKWPLQVHSFRQPHVTIVTCSPINALPSGSSSRFRQCSCAIAHAEKNVIR